MSDIRHHKIRFVERPEMDPAELEAELKKIDGVIDAKIDADHREVSVEYDLLKCREEDIERWMTEAGFVLDDSLRERIRRGWIRYTEENELDALRSRPLSCCDSEEIERRKKELE